MGPLNTFMGAKYVPYLEARQMALSVVKGLNKDPIFSCRLP